MLPIKYEWGGGGIFLLSINNWYCNGNLVQINMFIFLTGNKYY